MIFEETKINPIRSLFFLLSMVANNAWAEGPVYNIGVDGLDDDDSGGNVIWLSPGLQTVTKRWVWEAVLQKPISQHLHGTALANNLIVTAGFRVRF